MQRYHKSYKGCMKTTMDFAELKTRSDIFKAMLTPACSIYCVPVHA